MIRYILVDDDPQILDSVKAKIDKISETYELKHIESYHSSLKAYKEVKPTDFDLLIVDFEMPAYTGLELAKEIALNKKVIFLTSTTNNEKLVINSLDIAGFLSKPFEIDEFESILKNKIINKKHTLPFIKSNDHITLHIGKNRDVRFTPEQAYYISTSINVNGEKPDKNCVHIYGKNDEILNKNIRKSINELSEELVSHGFEKTSKSTIVNMSHIKERDNTNISLFSCKETFEITAKEKVGFVAKLRAKLNF